MTITVAALVCTNRPEWGKFVDYQIEKQNAALQHEIRLRTYRQMSFDDSIPVKRSELLHAALSDKCDYFAWFDDDDWSNPVRLSHAIWQMEECTLIDAVANVRADFVSVESRMSMRYHSPEGIIFNGAVFRNRSVPPSFARAMSVGEDTEWLMRWFRPGRSYIVTQVPMHAWLCHGKNVTNRANTRTFDGLSPNYITQRDWELVP